MKKIIFIADFFKDGPICGGAELHDDVVIQHLKSLDLPMYQNGLLLFFTN